MHNMSAQLAVAEPQEDESFTSFLQSFRARLHNLFHRRENIDQLSLERGLPPYVLREIMADSPFRTFISRELGGRGGSPAEGVALVEAASYESLPLALMFGINWALFIQPVSKYGQVEVRNRVLNDFVQRQKMGGLMITEPDYGSDALHMQTHWQETDGLCHLRGTKHWAGLTGWADYWLLSARRKVGEAGLARDIDFFIADASQPEQQVVVEEKYHNLGLYMLPYGRNRVDVRLPASQRLVPRSTGIKMMLDLLHRSRLHFPAMAMGFVRRIYDEAVEHCRQRQVGGRSLLSYDQVQARLARLQSAVSVCSALCINTCERAGLHQDLSGRGLEANLVKTYITDLMQQSAQSLLQLVGAKGYRLDHFAGRALVDSRPFQIFEGSNDILHIQISETLCKQMRVAREPNLQRFLAGFELTRRAAERLGNLLDLVPQPEMPQRKMAELGQVMSRIFALEKVLELGERGYERDAIELSSESLVSDIRMKLAGYSGSPGPQIDPEQVLSSWGEYCSKV